MVESFHTSFTNRIKKLLLLSKVRGVISDFVLEIVSADLLRFNETDPALLMYQLLGHSFKSAGGVGKPYETLELSWYLFIKAADLLDSLEDEDPIENIQTNYQKSEYINGATAILMLAYFGLNQFMTEQNYDSAAIIISRKFHNTLIDASTGQALELSLNMISLDEWWEITSTKSGGPYSVACWAGAYLASLEFDLALKYEKFGYHLGVIIQILDDARDLINNNYSLDSINPKVFTNSLPIVYTREVLADSELIAFEKCLDEINQNASKYYEIYPFLDQSGASNYMRTEIEKHRLLAIDALSDSRNVLRTSEILLEFLNMISSISA